MNTVPVDRSGILVKAMGLTSQTNPRRDLRPAFLDTRTGRVEIARFANGTPAPCHLTDGLPDEWIRGQRHSGEVVAVESFIVSGFVHDGRFLTRRQALRFVAATS